LTGISVIGLQWGDEAKGKMVDLLSRQYDIVVRYQGGANAGHTVVVGEEVYKLHHIPSGIIHDDVLNVIAPGVVIHPETICREIDTLTARGLDLTSRLLMSERAHVVFPWHLLEDQLLEQSDADDQENIGTTLRGIGPCYRDKVGRKFGIRLGDLIADNLPEKIERVAEFKTKILSAIADKPVKLDVAEIVDSYRKFAERLRKFIGDTSRLLLDAVEQEKSILLEGAQGALLDIDHGTFPYVTSSNSSGVGVCAGSGIAPRWISKTLGVAKCYSTRVGGGPFPTELHCETGQLIRDVGKEYGTTTGRPRRCGWFDAVAVRYTSRLSGIDSISLMMLDVLSELDEIKICTAYEIDGEIIHHFPSSVEKLRAAAPVYETLPGWKVDITKVERLDDLPENAKNYVHRIGELVGFSVEFVSVGPDRRQTIDCLGETLVAN
jgi:adenylosuccinate synthase